MSGEPWSPEAFEARYRANEDPWNFAESAFEQQRYDDILAELPERGDARAYEPGCSVGALSVRLAPRCARLDANDVSPTAVECARRRCAQYPHVNVTVGSVVDPPPRGLDLVVFAELGYYFDVGELGAIVVRLADALEPTGDLLACHWLGDSADHQLHGSVVHEVISDALSAKCKHVRHLARPEYVVDVWTRV
ncbi:MAG TPA: SAM-dependent methyltransferase [Acidimicrobiia bacterium]